MEDVLDLYHEPYEAALPVICMDEQPRQLTRELRRPVHPEPGRPARYDYEYERAGTANLFLFCEPLAGWRRVEVSERRTRLDWAHQVRRLLDRDYPDAERVRLVLDNLNTHNAASLYEAFEPAEARRLARRLEFHHTPRHGSWLNVAEVELSALSKQSLAGRIPDAETLAARPADWSHQRNGRQKGVDWQFTTDDARIKLKSLYPQIQT
jgi:hypothetical protein